MCKKIGQKLQKSRHILHRIEYQQKEQKIKMYVQI